MEISNNLKNDIKDIQFEISKAIYDHQTLAVKLKECPDIESQIKSDLTSIQKHLIELNDKQKVLLQQLRKDIEDNINNGQFVPVFNFNLYKIKPGQLEPKKRRRKDLSLAPKVMTLQPTHSPPSLSPSPTPSSSSSLSDDSVEYVSPTMLPVPVPRAMLLPDVKENLYLGRVSRRDLRPPKIKRKQKILSDEEVLKDIPLCYDPIPSPPPTDEKDLKAIFMTALGLIPKEMLHEILNRKVERKRRSTAINNPNFVYNNNWEIPAWKRSRTYLSPHKLEKLEGPKKIKGEEMVDGCLTTKIGKRERDLECEKSGRTLFEELKLPSGLTVERIDCKPKNSTAISTNSSGLCFVCQTAGLLHICKDCNVNYHLSCISPNSSVSCPCCKNKRSPDDGSSEDSSKEEFVSKCPNIAESYNKLKEYIENHTDSDTMSLFTERENYKIELMTKNQELYSQKRELEEKAAALSEALLLQEDTKNNLLKEEQRILNKIKIIVDFVSLYKKTNPKVDKSEEERGSQGKELKSQEGKNSNAEFNSAHSIRVLSKEGEENEDNNEEVEEEKKMQSGCQSPSSWKGSVGENSQSNYYSPELFSQESEANSPRNYENCDSSSQTSKESVANDTGNAENFESPSSKESLQNPIYELDETEENFPSQSVYCSEGIDYESSVDYN